jgi:hypothetical protein
MKSHSIAEELINKPKESAFKLENASTMRPYVNPNKIRGEPGNLSAQKSVRLIPIFKQMKFTKLKGVLPSILKKGNDTSLIKDKYKNQVLSDDFERIKLE